MFNIGLGELLLVLVVAFVVVGPDDLPKVARWLGRQLRKLRLLVRDIKEETGWNDIEKEVKDIQRDVKATVREVDIRNDIQSAVSDVKNEVKNVSDDVAKDMGEINSEFKKDTDFSKHGNQQNGTQSTKPQQ